MNYYGNFKRGLDIFIALAAMVILSPVLVVILITIRLSSKGPAIFKQERAGKNGRPFVFYKFRTMKLDVDPFGPSPKSGEDPRLTKVGIVGPRPLYLSQIPEWNERQKKRLLVKPGLTGLAQIGGRAELTREEKLELDVKYVETASFLADIRIILATIVQIFNRKNIYEKRYSKTEQTRGQGR